MKIRSIVLLIFATMQLVATQAEVVLKPIWGDRMVIQRNQEVVFSGQSTKRNGMLLVTPSWSLSNYSTTIEDDGSWSLVIPTPDAGRGYTIAFDDKCGNPLVLNDIMLGDVWLCMGQSNMAFKMRGAASQPNCGATNDIALAKESSAIRLFSVANMLSTTPVESYEGCWQSTNSAAVADFSAIGYLFGKQLNAALDIPIGLVSVNYGGTSLEHWMAREWLEEIGYNNFAAIDKGVVPKSGVNHQPTLRYNGMIAPLKGLSVKGMIWYQGEGNKAKYAQYPDYFSRFAKGLRDHFGATQPEGGFPIYCVQIAPYIAGNDPHWILMRESMMRIPDKSPNTGVVTTTDCGESTNIHPRYKRVVAERLALWALGDPICYGLQGFDYRAPEYKDMAVVEVKGRKTKVVRLSFDYEPNGLCFKTVEPSELFEIAGDDKVFYAARVKLLRTDKEYRLEVWSDEVAEPVAVRYAFKNYVEGDLFNTHGIPVSSFRTDDWELVEKGNKKSNSDK